MLFNLMVARKRKGLTQVQLAELVGVSVQSISAWENGKEMPRGDVLKKMAMVLDVTVDYLLEDVEVK